jgi:hypothetical protein
MSANALIEMTNSTTAVAESNSNHTMPSDSSRETSDSNLAVTQVAAVADSREANIHVTNKPNDPDNKNIIANKMSALDNDDSNVKVLISNKFIFYFSYFRVLFN